MNAGRNFRSLHRRYFPILTRGAEYLRRTFANDLVVAPNVMVMLIPRSLTWIIPEEIQGFGIPNRAATVRKRAVTCELDRIMNRRAARLLTRAALIASTSGSTHLIHA